MVKKQQETNKNHRHFDKTEKNFELQQQKKKKSNQVCSDLKYWSIDTTQHNVHCYLL
jgi:hypothetical protein